MNARVPIPASQPKRCPRCHNVLTIVLATHGTRWRCRCNAPPHGWLTLHAAPHRKERIAA